MRNAMKAIALAALALTAIGAGRHRSVLPPAPPAGPTFSKEVVRIFQDHCQSCHHPGDIAPFSLMSYHDAAFEALNIKLMTKTRQMPPWKPVAACGDFADRRVLTQAEIDTIAKWVENGAPEGNPADLPPPIDFSSGWTLGQPDLVLSYPESYTPPASGDMYRCLPLPTNLTADQYVSAIDVHPGDRKSVHHVIAFIDKGTEAARLDQADPAPGYQCFGGPGFTPTDPSAATLGGWAPGQTATRFPEEVAFSLPKNSTVVLQVHYHPHDPQPQADKTEIGIYFAKKKPQKLLRVLPVWNQLLAIPPNDPDHAEVATFDVPVFAPPLHVWAIYPHMHLLGRSMYVQASSPSGSTTCLINIKDWDFNWQGMYRYNDPIAMGPLTHIDAVAHYDNSADNLRNPNSPPKAVYWGEQTTDEMLIAFLVFTLDSENLTKSGQLQASWVPPLPR